MLRIYEESVAKESPGWSQILNLTWLAYSTTVLEANALPVLKYVKRNIDRAAANRAAAANKVSSYFAHKVSSAVVMSKTRDLGTF
jgi:chaperone required for assembly of F1-ATPase